MLLCGRLWLILFPTQDFLISQVWILRAIMQKNYVCITAQGILKLSAAPAWTSFTNRPFSSDGGCCPLWNRCSHGGYDLAHFKLEVCFYLTPSDCLEKRKIIVFVSGNGKERSHDFSRRRLTDMKPGSIKKLLMLPLIVRQVILLEQERLFDWLGCFCRAQISISF